MLNANYTIATPWPCVTVTTALSPVDASHNGRAQLGLTAVSLG
jgi:hypothetical protein